MLPPREIARYHLPGAESPFGELTGTINCLVLSLEIYHTIYIYVHIQQLDMYIYSSCRYCNDNNNKINNNHDNKLQIILTIDNNNDDNCNNNSDNNINNNSDNNINNNNGNNNDI